jgi:predicted transcriptional regulator
VRVEVSQGRVSHTQRAVKIDVRAIGLKKMLEARGLTQRQLAHLSISQNYIPAMESGGCRPGPNHQEQFTKASSAPSKTCSISC